MPAEANETHLDALGTTVTLRGHGHEQAAATVRRLEGLLTRFCPSALTALNESGELRPPPAELVAAVQHALGVAAATGGLVTPTVLPALEAAGYAARPGDTVAAGHAVSVPPVAGILCTPALIRLPPGVRLDLGGTAKSWIAERAFAVMRGDAVVDAGGDLMLRQSTLFAVEVELPGAAPLYLNCPAGTWGVATSSTLRRAWAGGHHLLDPRTARPLRSRFVQATALCARVTAAEVLTKLALLDDAALDRAVRAAGPAQVYAVDHAGELWQRRPGQWHNLELPAGERCRPAARPLRQPSK